MKAIAVLRVSTDSQQIDDQRDELFDFMRSEGYDDIVPIEAVGASAVMLNDKYLYMVQRIKDAINMDKDIKAVFVWHLNRLGRNDVVLMDFKEFFIKNHVQFICKNPYLKLLNEDGSVNAGMELAFSLFSTMSKQDAEERKAKFKRAKSAMMKKGQYTGGNLRKFGYKIVGKEYDIDEEESKVVRMVFDLYSTGQYSTYSLSKEMEERGYAVDGRQICRILKSDAYYGNEVGEYGLHYRPIISKELFDKCAEIRNANKIDMKRGKRTILGGKLVKCPVCGATCTSNSRHYVCSRHAHRGECANGFALRQCVADGLLWRIAQTEHLQYLVDMNENNTDEYQKQLETVEEKLSAAKKKTDDFTKKKQRIVETYLEGLIDKKSRDLKIAKLEDEAKFQMEYMAQLEDKKRAIVALLETKVDTMEAFEAALDNLDASDKFEVIHKHIIKLTATQESFGKRDPRTTRPNGVRIVIDTAKGTSYTFMYVPKFYDGNNLFQLVRGKWHRDHIEITDKAINTKKKKGD